LHPPLPELLVEPPVLDEPPVLEEPATHDPFEHVPLDAVQSVHMPAPVPQAVSTFVWQVPVLSQQPIGQDVALQLLEPPSLVLDPPPLVLDPPPLVLDPPPLVLDPLDPLALPPLLVLLDPSPLAPPPPLDVERPASRDSATESAGASAGPPVAQAKATPPTANKTIPRAAHCPRKCILSIYLPALPYARAYRGRDGAETALQR
jgi:hypothetical protein